MIERASEFGASATAPLAEVSGDTALLSAGNLLRQAREAHDLPIEVVAAALKVPPHKLQALEDDNIDALPDPVFARALAASVARALRIDPAPVLAKLPGARQATLAESDRSMSGNIRNHPHRSTSRQPQGWSLPRPLLAVVVVLLLAAAAVFWLPQSAFERANAWVAQVTQRSPGPATSTVSEGVVAPAAATVEPSAGGVGPVVPAEPAAAPAAPPPEPVAPVPAEVLSLVATRGESWVTVTEAGGKVLLRRLVTAGETVNLSGALPLSVVVGRASNVDVRVRGNAFDLLPMTKSGGVARFEVKS